MDAHLEWHDGNALSRRSQRGVGVPHLQQKKNKVLLRPRNMAQRPWPAWLQDAREWGVECAADARVRGVRSVRGVRGVERMEGPRVGARCLPAHLSAQRRALGWFFFRNDPS